MKPSHVLFAVFVLLTIALVAGAAQRTAASPQPPTFTEAEFETLRWIEGSWKGTGGSGVFYERYRFASPTKIVIEYFADEQLTKSGGPDGLVELRDGRIVHEAGRGRWQASKLDASSVRFEPVEGASNAFSWTRKSRDAWTAVLYRANGAELKYELTRVP